MVLVLLVSSGCSQKSKTSSNSSSSKETISSDAISLNSEDTSTQTSTEQVSSDNKFASSKGDSSKKTSSKVSTLNPYESSSKTPSSSIAPIPTVTVLIPEGFKLLDFLLLLYMKPQNPPPFSLAPMTL